MEEAIHKNCSRKFHVHVAVDGTIGGQFFDNFQHVLKIRGHPHGAARLIEVATRGKRCATIKDSDIVQAKETAFEDVVAG